MGGTAPYTYAWSNGATTATITSLSPGNYWVTVSDGTGASATQYVSIASVVTVHVVRTMEVCPPGANGELTAMVTGGSAPYTYLWSDGSTLVHRTGLYNDDVIAMRLTVTDFNGCIAQSDSIIQGMPAFRYSLFDTPAICPSTTGKLTAYPYGGVMPYTYSWSNGATTSSITATVGMHYQVTITDAAGCRATRLPWNTDSITSQSTFYVSLATTNEVCGNGAGALVTNISGVGASPYTYRWSTGQTSANLTGLHEGYFLVTVTDNNGCSALGFGFVRNQSPISLSVSSVPKRCGNGSGSLAVVANGGTTPYTYKWSTGATTQTITGLRTGSYVVTVRDATGCTALRTGYVHNTSPVSPNVTSQNEVCSNGAGWARANPTLGTAPYSYKWSTGQTTAQITGLSVGYYYVTVTDAVGCSATAFANVNNSSPISPNGSYVTATCSNLNGSATVAPTGGLAPYTYLWNTSPPRFTAHLSGIGVGYYSCTITDANGCTVTTGRT